MTTEQNTPAAPQGNSDQTFRVRTPSGDEMHLRVKTADEAALHMRPCFGFETGTLEVTDAQGRVTFHDRLRANAPAKPEGAVRETTGSYHQAPEQVRAERRKLRHIVVKLIGWYERPNDDQSHGLVELIREAGRALTETDADVFPERPFAQNNPRPPTCRPDKLAALAPSPGSVAQDFGVVIDHRPIAETAATDSAGVAQGGEEGKSVH